ncbi:hypothetical protein TRFO_23726 [Tritrichomonas foetus]|uniref:RRM domain-containing protein n=1 Tax=Tritrichomonas foetus TaxID=1144522 RepID=A0A1J4KEP9_9EUKA|nr:hypothetical protein TRFO_23726 [Tritrichomonas foetus]|eukprot:OHT07869.1 hypothetical protein TRFO_23726 [Tritrichomonas foetus]
MYEKVTNEMEKAATIYINNLPSDTTPEQVTDKFNEFGKVKSVRLLRTTSGECRGYAFLDYQTDDEALKAIYEGNNCEFRGNRLKVERTRHQLGDPPRSKRSHQSYRLEYGRYTTDRPHSPYSARRGPRDESPEYRRSHRLDHGFDGRSFIQNGARYIDDSPPPRYRDEFARDRRSSSHFRVRPDRINDRIPVRYDDRFPDKISDRNIDIIIDHSPHSQSQSRSYRYPRDVSPPPRRIVSSDRHIDEHHIYRRIIDDSPPPRRIIDDPQPPRRIIEDSPPPKRI